MAGQGRTGPPGAGPGNKPIATTLLELLAVRGRTAAGERARRALDPEAAGEGGLADAGVWLPAGAIGAMFVAADVDPAIARAVGQRLAAPDATGLRLYGLGLATPEKAYRRIQALLPREAEGARWAAEEIDSGRARMRFEAAEGADASAGGTAGNQALCAMRTGMLEAIPGLYGLLPAKVQHARDCIASGADACRYEVEFPRTSRAGLLAGAELGLIVALSLAAAVALLGPARLPLAPCVVAGLAALMLGPVLGRAVDLKRQLEAVAGARRGHLALFDQVDDALASKLDALARADARLEGEEMPSARRRIAPAESSEEAIERERVEARSAAHEIHAAAGDLECLIEKWERQEETPLSSVAEARALVREVREWAARMARAGTADDEPTRGSVRLEALLRRAVASARPTLDTRAKIEIEAEEGLPPIFCDPVQIEQVVVQLVRNAVEASAGMAVIPEVWVCLRGSPQGVELAVEDRGVGIDSTEVDEVFDPFFGDRRTGIEAGFGLPVCLRIVERHGGELRIESEERSGTRVSILLPTTSVEV